MRARSSRSTASLAPLLVAVAATALALSSCTTTTDAGSTTRPTTSEEEAAQYLFVQTADHVSFQGGTMTLHGVAPTTLFFTDRPVRISGHQDTSAFVGEWSEGADSFAVDAPNAALSVLGRGNREVAEVVVELHEPKLANGNLTYRIDVLEGTPPSTGDVCALFIDAIRRHSLYASSGHVSSGPASIPSGAGVGGRDDHGVDRRGHTRRVARIRHTPRPKAHHR